MKRFLVILVCVLALALAGCAKTAPKKAEGPDLSARPSAWDLSDPQTSVKSYLDWTALAYRFANSEIASKTTTPDHGVRVDSYIQLNREKGRGIDQSLKQYEVVSASMVATRALVATKESWDYRYFALATRRFQSKRLTASYDVTYTVLHQDDGSWLVDDVDAKAYGEVR